MIEDLPGGVQLFDLKTHRDPRGTLLEVFRSGEVLPPFQQLNFVQSEPGVLRGVHVHPDHADYLFVLSGRLILGLHDIRRESESFGRSSLITLDAGEPKGCFIPVGVAHGFYLPVATNFIYGLSAEWRPDGDFGCRWDDPDLGIDWPVTGEPLLSDRDKNAPSLASMIAEYDRLVDGKRCS